MAEASKYRLRVTAGPSYDPSTHSLVHVNTPESVHIKTPAIDASVNVRIKNYRGIPATAPATSPYFSAAPHTSDLYSISFAFSLPAGTAPIPGNALLFGNDFDRPIRDSLPPGTSTAMWIVKRWIDPGMDGDAYADKPHMYGPLLSSINVLRVDDPTAGAQPGDDRDEAAAWAEGGADAGAEYRDGLGVPGDGAARMKHFLTEGKKEEFEFRPGLTYKCDFFNPYLDFNEFAIKLPGFSVGIMSFWDGQPLRYVLKRKVSEGADVVNDEPLFVIVIALLKEEDIEAEEKRWIGASRGEGSNEASDQPSSKPDLSTRTTNNDDDVD